MITVLDKTYEEFVEDWLKVDLDNLDGFKSLPERLLTAIEEAGMLPPPDNLYFSLQKDKSWIAEYWNNRPDNLWEPEDE